MLLLKHINTENGKKQENIIDRRRERQKKGLENTKECALYVLLIFAIVSFEQKEKERESLCLS